MLKKIDILMLKSFAGPFVVAFVLALFVFIMQFFWLYIDEIAGKGVGFLMISQLTGYLSISLIPLALPVAILLASVLVIGGLGEHYELTSMKSAGISLLRIMRMLIMVGLGLSFFSYFTSDFLTPIANLGFKSRLTDIRRQKPALALDEGVFNTDFNNFIIRIQEKLGDNQTIKGVLIEENRNSKLRLNQTLADSGRMFTTADENYFVMNLYNGTQYQQPDRTQRNPNEKSPFVRIKFKEWTKVFDLGEFEIKRTDEERFSNQRTMMSMEELRARMDTLTMEISDLKTRTAKDMIAQPKRMLDDSLALVKARAKKPQTKNPQNKDEAALKFGHKNNSAVAVQKLEKSINEYSSLLETFHADNHEKLRREAEATLRGYRNTLLSRDRQIENKHLDFAKTGYELYIKYSNAIVCFIFMFIGCCMGALIRKGGYGWSLLTAIVFFVAYIFLTISCRKLAESFRMTPFWAAMTPCVILAPIAALLTYLALHDGTISSSKFKKVTLALHSVWRITRTFWI